MFVEIETGYWLNVDQIKEILYTYSERNDKYVIEIRHKGGLEVIVKDELIKKIDKQFSLELKRDE